MTVESVCVCVCVSGAAAAPDPAIGVDGIVLGDDSVSREDIAFCERTQTCLELLDLPGQASLGIQPLDLFDVPVPGTRIV